MPRDCRQAVLRNDASYAWNIAKQCIFDPGVAYRVWRGNESVVILICFHCDEVGIVADKTQPEEITIHSCDPGRPALLKLAKEAMPDDKEIQALK